MAKRVSLVLGSDGLPQQLQSADFIDVAEMPGVAQPFPSGRWLLPEDIAPSAGAAPGSGSIRLFPKLLLRAVTIQALGCRCTTGAAATNIRLGIYNADPTTGLPTTLNCQTAGLSTAAAGTVSGAISGGNATLQPGLYWFAAQTDNATTVFICCSTGNTTCGNLSGDTSLATLLPSVPATVNHRSFAGSYATGLQDLTSQTTVTQSSANNVMVVFQVA